MHHLFARRKGCPSGGEVPFARVRAQGCGSERDHVLIDVLEEVTS